MIPMDSPDEHERFMRLFLAHEAVILRTVLIFVPQEADARDIVQETAIALWQHFSSYDPARPFGTWACGFARMEVRRFLRRAHRRAALTARATEAILQTEESLAVGLDERERHLEECRRELGSRHRQVLDAYYSENISVNALAEQQGRSVEAIYKMLQRIRSALLECMDRKAADHRP